VRRWREWMSKCTITGNSGIELLLASSSGDD
jgi:hypothetical protein